MSGFLMREFAGTKTPAPASGSSWRPPPAQRPASREGGTRFDHDFSTVGVFNPVGKGMQQQPAPKTPPTTAPTSAPATPPAKPLHYNETPYSLGSPDSGWTEASLETRVKELLTSVTVSGVTTGMPAETRLYLLYILRQLSEKENWGTELDVVAPIGRAAKAGDPDPLGRVTVRIDEKGNGEVELIAAGPPVQSPVTTVAAASAQLITDYGFASVKDDATAKWSDAEIADVSAALKMLPEVDKASLKGVELIRVKWLGTGIAGQFSVGGGVLPYALTVSGLPFLKLTDRAFAAANSLQFYGGTKFTVPASYNTILHEVAHAVEMETYRTATEARDQAAIDMHQEIVPLKAANDEHGRLTEEYRKLYKIYEKESDKTKKATLAKKLVAIDTARTAEVKKSIKADKKYQAAAKVRDAKDLAVKATRVDTAVVTPFDSEATAKKTDAATALSTAKTKIGLLKQELVTSSKAYADAVEATAAAIETYATSGIAPGADIDRLERTVFAQIQARDTERGNLVKLAPSHQALPLLKRAADAQDAWLAAARMAVRAPRRTLRVQKFVDLVTAKKIAPFTDYAKTNWPHQPEEFYAEAYALWLTDPDFLAKNYADVYDFFQSGEYRK
jgi:hypothetical protein